MKRTSLSSMQCSVAQALDVVGDPWTLLIIRDALFDVTRFDDFQQRLGIPRTTLSTRLGTLVDHGVLERHEYQSNPPRHDYRLTAKGRALHPVVVAMLQWGDEWSDLDEPPVTLVDATTDAAIDPVYVDRATSTPISDITITRRFNTATAFPATDR